MQIVDTLPHAIQVTDHVLIPMPDGIRLSARIWRPVGDGRYPAILEYIPYRKRDGTAPRDAHMHPYFAGHGYAAVRVDLRGSGDSEGLLADEYTAQELDDACAVIDWLSRQDWCTGRVGMMGKSWGGFNCLQTAFLAPPALRAVVSVCSTTDRFADDIHFKGGCLLGENIGWGAVMLSYSSRPADPALRPDWRADWLARLQAEPFLAPRWAAHQGRDAYWRHGSVAEDWAAIRAPVQVWGGWADNYMNTVGHLVENLTVPVKGIVGPWVHQYPHQAVPAPAVGFLDEALRWWDRWLKDAPTGAEGDPALRLWVQHSAPPNASAAHRPGHWLSLPDWPAPEVTATTLPLSPGRIDGTGGPLGQVCTPQHLGLMAGEFFPMGLAAEMPGDQRLDDALSLCFDGAVLDEPLTLIGAATLRLRLSSDRPRAFIVARLCDVAPDGASTRLAHGMLNLCHAAGMADPAPLTPGAEVDATLTLDLMAHRLAPGHRLRLGLSTTYWPFVWPSPEPATLTLTEGSLTLPLHPGEGAGWTPPEPKAAPPWPQRVIRPPHAERRIDHDLLPGTRTLTIVDDGGEVEHLEHGLVTAYRSEEQWVIGDDPLSAEVTIRWEQELSRGDWRVRTLATARLTGTATELIHEGRLVAFEGETPVFERDFHESVPRHVI